MEKSTQELLKNEFENLEIDWTSIKAALTAVDGTLQVMCASVPSGIFKTIICGLETGISLLISLIPNSSFDNVNRESKL